MNCKQGDLAVIKKPWEIKKDLGLVVNVVRIGNRGEVVKMKGEGRSICEHPYGGVSWLVEAHADGFPCFVADECLRPIRDPGEDATDETLVLLGKPEKETV